MENNESQAPAVEQPAADDDIEKIIASGKAAVASKEQDDALKEKVVTYTQFDELQDFPEDHLFKTDFNKFISEDMIPRMADHEAWNEQFEGINFLRQMNKFHKDLLVANLGQFESFISVSVMNLRSGIQKNSLMFTTEFFRNEFQDCDVTLIAFVKIVLPSCMFKTTYDKVFIAKEAKNSVTASLNSCKFIETLQVLIEDGCLCKGNNKMLIENSYGFIDAFIKGVDNQFLGPVLEGEKTLVQMVNQVYDGVNSAPRIKKVSTEVFKNLNIKLQKGDPLTFEKLLQMGFKSEKQVENGEEAKEGENLPYDDEKVQKIIKLVSGNSKKAAPAGGKKDFRSFLKQQKQQVDKDPEVAAVIKDSGLDEIKM